MLPIGMSSVQQFLKGLQEGDIVEVARRAPRVCLASSWHETIHNRGCKERTFGDSCGMLPS
jgi:hypothetical protein